MAIRFVNIAGFLSGSLLYTPNSLTDFRGVGYPGINTIYTEGANILSDILADNVMYTIYDNGILKITADSRGNKTTVYFYVYYNNVQINTIPISAAGDTPLLYLGMCFAVDDDTEMGNIFFLSQSNYYGSYDMFFAGGDTTLHHETYLAIIGSEQPLYTWSSVPAISGKNGILTLTTLKEESINDGSPVDDATASAFNNAPNSCSVGGIVSVDLPIVDDNPLSIAVKYNIPELTDSVYSSCKVVAKKNKIPKSKTDGDKILDVSPSSHGCVIKGLEQETKYYVVVFVEDSFGNKAESEPGGPVRTGKQSGIFKMRMTTSQGIRDGGFKETITITQQ